MNKKVYVAIPAYDTRIDALCMFSIINNMRDLEKNGYEVVFNCKMGDPYIDQARNWLVDAFLKTDCTEMIFVDTDLAFDTEGMRRLVESDVDVVGGVYPFRSEEQNGYPITIKLDKDNKPFVDYDKGLVECKYIPTGFMKIKRGAFTVLKEAYPKFTDDNKETKYFRTGQVFINEGDNRWWGEDNYFCEICNRCGIKVYCDPMISFVHFGRLNKKGKYADFLQNGGKWLHEKTETKSEE